MSALGVEAGESVSPRIMVVEDEWTIGDALGDVLTEMGAVVTVARDACEAWNFLRAGVEVDVVFTDNRMPGPMTGAQLANRIIGRWPLVTIMVTSALPVPEWSGLTVAKPYDIFGIASLLIGLARA